jgi:DNA-binding transcriptional LysR family regulator
MELRHRRYFVAVAEAESLTVARERQPHSSQPSLGRQICGARGIELTPASALCKTWLRGRAH